MDDYPSKIVHSAPNSPESQLLGKPILTLPTLAKNASPFNQILNEAKYLAEQGVKEIILLGQNVNAYNYNENKLSDLIIEISKIKKIKRI